MQADDDRPTTLFNAPLLIIGLCGIWLLSLLFLPFIKGITWGIVLALVLYPVFDRGLQKFNYPTAVALLITILTALLIGGIVLPLALELHNEIQESVKLNHLTSLLPHVDSLKPFAKSIEGELGTVASFIGTLAQGVASSIWTAATAFFTLFFLLRDGALLVDQLQKVTKRVFGATFCALLTVAQQTIIKTFYGTTLTAITQGFLAGVGFYFAGAPIPAILGGLTCFFSLLPFGTPMIYLPVCIYLGLHLQSWVVPILLLCWCVMVVSMADNVLRTLFISQTMNLPFFLVFIGVVGGIVSFGLIGLFVAPAIIAVALEIWRKVYEDSMVDPPQSSAIE